jgi:hypothetical protein
VDGAVITATLGLSAFTGYYSSVLDKRLISILSWTNVGVIWVGNIYWIERAVERINRERINGAVIKLLTRYPIEETFPLIL